MVTTLFVTASAKYFSASLLYSTDSFLKIKQLSSTSVTITLSLAIAFSPYALTLIRKVTVPVFSFISNTVTSLLPFIIYLLVVTAPDVYLRATTCAVLLISPSMFMFTLLVTSFTFPTSLAKYLNSIFARDESSPGKKLSPRENVTEKPVPPFDIVIFPSSLCVPVRLSPV